MTADDRAAFERDWRWAHRLAELGLTPAQIAALFRLRAECDAGQCSEWTAEGLRRLAFARYLYEQGRLQR